MTHPTDTLVDDLGKGLRVGLHAALLFGEDLARRREQRARDAATESAARARALADRLRTEQRCAETALRSVHRDRWWTTATPDQIIEQMRVAHTWKDTSPIAADAAAVIDEQLQSRYAIARTHDLDMAAVTAAVQRDVAAHQARDAAAARYRDAGYTVLTEEPRGPGFVDAAYLETIDPTRAFAPTVGPVTEEVTAAHPAAWAVHLVHDRATGADVPRFYCTDLDAAPNVGWDGLPPVTRVWDQKFMDCATPEILGFLYPELDGAPVAQAHFAQTVRERFGVNLATVDNPGETHAPVAEILASADVARDDPDAARRDAATVDRTAAVTAAVGDGDLDEGQVAAAWQWATETNPRGAEHALYGRDGMNTSIEWSIVSGGPNGDRGYERHVMEQWASEHRPGLLDDLRSHYPELDNGGPTRSSELEREWTAAGQTFPRLDPREAFGPPLPVTSTDLPTVLAWAKDHVPRDAERYDTGTGRTKTAAEQHMRTSYDLAHAQQWANDRAPALAAQYAQAQASADRDAYLTARTHLVHEWNTAGRPTPDPEPVSASPDKTPAYDSRERRAALADTLAAAGVDPAAVDARLAADRDNAHPIGTPSPTGATAPTASKGDHSKTRSISNERGDR